ncbi:MAG TPA: serine hydrolase domain-containing protein, partial [Clostridia bacterium]|nr:serine hydrolase domain-containing protein [Clostridia bacterium]
MNFAALTDYLDHLDERFGVPAADCAVYRDGRLVYRHMAGYSDAARTKPLTENTMYWVYSATKLYTCTAALQLVERGLVGLDDPVCKYIPEFAAPLVKAEGGLVPAERQITVRHLFTMTAGLNYDIATPAIVTLKKCTGDRATMRAV